MHFALISCRVFKLMNDGILWYVLIVVRVSRGRFARPHARTRYSETMSRFWFTHRWFAACVEVHTLLVRHSRARVAQNGASVLARERQVRPKKASCSSFGLIRGLYSLASF